MTVTLNLPPDVEAGLLAQAQTHGLPLETYIVQHVLRDAAKPVKPAAARQSLAQFLMNSPLAGANLDLERRKEYPRSVEL